MGKRNVWLETVSRGSRWVNRLVIIRSWRVFHNAIPDCPWDDQSARSYKARDYGRITT